jgi:hypothetical protein
VAPDGPSLQPTASSLIAKWGQSKGLWLPMCRGQEGVVGPWPKVEGGVGWVG